jgi:signal transduction histidine kinase
VARHAGRATAIVRLTYGTGELVVEVIDDGVSLNRNGLRPSGTGSGIAGMRERAVALRGQFHAARVPGGGFAVTAHLPTGVQT